MNVKLSDLFNLNLFFFFILRYVNLLFKSHDLIWQNLANVKKLYVKKLNAKIHLHWEP